MFHHFDITLATSFEMACSAAVRQAGVIRLNDIAASTLGVALPTLRRAFRELQGVAFRDELLREWHGQLPTPT